MGVPVLIMGPSGSGKSASLRNFKNNIKTPIFWSFLLQKTKCPTQALQARVALDLIN